VVENSEGLVENSKGLVENCEGLIKNCEGVFESCEGLVEICKGLVENCLVIVEEYTCNLQHCLAPYSFVFLHLDIKHTIISLFPQTSFFSLFL